MLMKRGAVMSLFHERFNKLKEKSGKTQTLIAEELGISKQQMSYYANGREPDYDTLIKIAELFDVSTDYLLGITDVPAKDVDIRAICEYTGLSEENVDFLETLREHLEIGKKYNETYDLIPNGYSDIEIVNMILERLNYSPSIFLDIKSCFAHLGNGSSFDLESAIKNDSSDVYLNCHLLDKYPEAYNYLKQEQAVVLPRYLAIDYLIDKLKNDVGDTFKLLIYKKSDDPMHRRYCEFEKDNDHYSMAVISRLTIERLSQKMEEGEQNANNHGEKRDV